MKLASAILTCGVLFSSVPPPRPGHPASPAGTASETGTVLATFHWDGETPPPPLHLTVPAKTAEGCCPEGVSVDDIDRSLLVSKEGGIAGVVVLLSPVEGTIEREVPAEPFVLNQVHCRYEPHILVVPRGARLELHNSDSINHNIHTYSHKNEPFNNNLAGKTTDVRTLDAAENILVKCDIHSWMGAYVIVTEAPFFGVSGADGTVRIEGIPPGTYQGSWWHEKLGKGKLEELKVEAGGVAEVALKLKPRERKHRHR